MVDLCCGSGSGVVAALRMGYNAVGLDINETQVQATAERVRSFGELEVRKTTHLAFCNCTCIMLSFFNLFFCITFCLLCVFAE